MSIAKAHGYRDGMNKLKRSPTVVIVLMLAACGGGSATPVSPTPVAPTVLSVGGTYGVTKAYVNTACGTDLASLAATITVDHSPGSLTFVIREGFGSYQGTVSNDGRFEASQVVTDHVPPLRITLREGRFTANGLEARNVWEMFANGQDRPATCTGELSYSGRRTGGTNTFP